MATVAEGTPPKDRLSWQQRMLDEVFLLIVAGMIIPTVLYIVFGLVSLYSVPEFVP
jgi:hypothetical protein